ncbi:MAG: hypothetical protein ACOVLC_03075 [Flavobacterium sp.]
MKKIKFLSIISFTIGILFTSCSTNTIDETAVDQEINNSASISRENVSSPSEFLQSVALIQKGGIEDPLNNGKYIFIIELKDFSENIVFNEAYNIDGVEYSDNGRFNDEVANDGIYTSVESYRIIQNDNNIDVMNTTIVNKSESFQYGEELNNYIHTPNAKTKVKFGCKVRTVTCPETSWLNNCWFGSPCTCIEFYDCEASIEVEIEL